MFRFNNSTSMSNAAMLATSQTRWPDLMPVHPTFRSGTVQRRRGDRRADDPRSIDLASPASHTRSHARVRRPAVADIRMRSSGMGSQGLTHRLPQRESHASAEMSRVVEGMLSANQSRINQRDVVTGAVGRAFLLTGACDRAPNGGERLPGQVRNYVRQRKRGSSKSFVRPGVTRWPISTSRCSNPSLGSP